MTIPNKTFSNIQLRRGTAATWTANNPLLLSGEVGIETDTNKVKIGNGVDLWNDLDYFVGGGSVSLALDELSDVDTTGAADGDALVYDSGTSTWIPGESASSVFVSDTAPLTPSAGDLWFDSTNGNTYIYYVDTDSSQWVGFGGGSSGYILGTVYPWPTSAVPSWALELNGQAVSRTTYSGLFAILGTTYGVGDGSTTFNLPNYKGRTLVGQDTAQTEFDVLGETGGAKTHTLTTSEMPAHTHTTKINTSVTGALSAGSTTFRVDIGGTDTTSSAGGGAAHNNLQPYTVVKWIICAATSAGEFDTEVQTALVSSVDQLTSVVDRSPQGVIPSSVVVGSGSATVGTDGVITFTGCSSISFNDFFDGLGADIYQAAIFFESTTAGSVVLRLRSAGVDKTTLNYRTAVYTDLSVGPTLAAGSSVAEIVAMNPTTGGTAFSGTSRIQFARPGVVGRTYTIGDTSVNVTGDRFFNWRDSGTQIESIDFDGFTLVKSSGVFSGYVKVVKLA